MNPFEPTYCTCGQVAFGEMIACDAEDCPVEWFHCACVGIAPSNRPKNDWYCPLCAPKQLSSAATTPAAASAATVGTAGLPTPGSSAPASAQTHTAGGVGDAGSALGELSILASAHGSELAAALLAGALPGLQLGLERAPQMPTNDASPSTHGSNTGERKRARSVSGGSDATSDVSISALMQEVVADAAGVDKRWSVHSPARKAASAVASERLRRAAKRRRRLEMASSSGGGGGGVWGAAAADTSSQASLSDASSTSSGEEGVAALSDSRSGSDSDSGSTSSDSSSSSSGARPVRGRRQAAARAGGRGVPGGGRRLPKRTARPVSLKE